MVDAARRLSWDTKKGEKLWQGRRLAASPSLLLGASIYDVRITFGIFYRPLLLVRNWESTCSRKYSEGNLTIRHPQTSCALYSQSKQKEAWPENGIIH